MNNVLRICIITAALIFLSQPGFGDIVVTADGMIVNGKIIEQVENSHVTIANYHGTFTIRKENIREQHKTDNYRKDIELFKKMGKTASEAEVKKTMRPVLKSSRPEAPKAKAPGNQPHTCCLPAPS